MIINHYKEPFFHIVVNNVFSESVLTVIHEDINLLKSELKSEEHTSSATDDKGNYLKKTKGIFLYESENFEKLKIMDYVGDILKAISKSNWNNKSFHRMFKRSFWGSELLSRYTHGDYYTPHVDDGIFTMVTYFYDNYENITGGDLYFPEHDHLHKCKDNQSILFFSKEVHGVTPVKTDLKSNRYSITSFTAYESDIPKKLIIKN